MNRTWWTGLALVACLPVMVSPALADEDSEERKKWGCAGWDKGFKFERLQADYRRLGFEAQSDDNATVDELRIQFQLSF